MISKKNLIQASIFTFFLFFSAPLQAQQAITIDQARVIHQGFQSAIDDLNRQTQAKFKTEGELLVEPTDSYYAVTLPKFLVEMGDGKTIDYGFIALNLVPSLTEGQWMVSLALPTEITAIDKQGDILSKLSIGEQNFKGLWDTKLNWFASLESVLGNVKLSDNQTGETALIKTLKITGTNETGLDPEALNMIGQVNFEGIKTTLHDNKALLMADKLDFAYDISDLKFSYLDQLKEIIAPLQEEDIGDFDVPPTPQFGEMMTHLVLNNMMWTIPEDQKSFKVNTLAVKGTHAIREQGLMDSDTQINVSGIAFSGEEESVTQWLPQEFSSHVQINNFPRQAIQNALSDVLPGQEIFNIKANGKKIEVKDLDTEAVKAAFVNAGTEYNIDHLKVKTPIGAGVDVKGQVVATEGAPYTVAGAINLGLMGLDQVSAVLQKKTAEALLKSSQDDAPKDFVTPMMAQQGLIGIMMLQGFGETEKTPEGQTVTRFNITLPREGGIRINDQDIGGLLDLLPKGQEKTQ